MLCCAKAKGTTSKDRISGLLRKPCKCVSGDCYKPLHKPDVSSFLQSLEKLGKREQDAVLFLACGSNIMGADGEAEKRRREYYVLGQPMKRVCTEHLLGVGPGRTDKVGGIDMRYGQRGTRPSQLTASIDAFCCVLYNSIAEPLPDKIHG